MQYCQSLLTAPEFDEIIRHDNVMEPLQALMGGEVSFGSCCLNNMGPYEGEPVAGMRTWDGPVGRRWHRDGGHQLMWREHPLHEVAALPYRRGRHDPRVLHSAESIDPEVVSIEAQLAEGGHRESRLRPGLLFSHPTQRLGKASRTRCTAVCNRSVWGLVAAAVRAVQEM